MTIYSGIFVSFQKNFYLLRTILWFHHHHCMFTASPSLPTTLILSTYNSWPLDLQLLTSRPTILDLSTYNPRYIALSTTQFLPIHEHAINYSDRLGPFHSVVLFLVSLDFKHSPSCYLYHRISPSLPQTLTLSTSNSCYLYLKLLFFRPLALKPTPHSGVSHWLHLKWIRC